MAALIQWRVCDALGGHYIVNGHQGVADDDEVTIFRSGDPIAYFYRPVSCVRVVSYEEEASGSNQDTDEA